MCGLRPLRWVALSAVGVCVCFGPRPGPGLGNSFHTQNTVSPRVTVASCCVGPFRPGASRSTDVASIYLLSDSGCCWALCASMPSAAFAPSRTSAPKKTVHIRTAGAERRKSLAKHEEFDPQTALQTQQTSSGILKKMFRFGFFTRIGIWSPSSVYPEGAPARRRKSLVCAQCLGLAYENAHRF